MKLFLGNIATLLLVFFAIAIKAQQPDTIVKYSLEDLMNMEVASASHFLTPALESPGIVSVITENEIKNSGSKCLMDVLQMVPGFDFVSEWDNIIGVGVRGNNATEGKFLILLDGMVLNETNFGSFAFSNHILLDDIDRIEIIRGPGSAVYGGSAELAVINIITKKGSNINGISFNSGYYMANSQTSGFNTSLSFGKKITSNLELKISGSYAKANQSNVKLECLDSTLLNYADSSGIETANLNLALAYKKFNIQAMYDKYLSRNTEAVGYILFEGIHTRTHYRFSINNKFYCTPEITYNMHKPWYFVSNKNKEYYNTLNSRAAVTIPVTYEFYKNSSAALGVEAFNDYSKKITDTVVFSSNRKKSISYNNYALFAELESKSKIGNIIAGARFDVHDVYGNSFTPRIAYTKIFEKVHFKLLYSKAFKAPTISNIDYNNNIKPEKTTAIEFEIGYWLNKETNLTLNIFDIQIKNPILYIPNPITGADYYTNYPSTGSRGIECEYKIKDKWGYLIFTYSFYKKAYNKVPDYNVSGIPSVYGAFPTHKAGVKTKIQLTKNINLASSCLFYGTRYTYIHNNKNWSSSSLVKYKPMYLVNVCLSYAHAFNSGFSFSAGVNDATNQKFEFINAYNGWQNQIPAQGREFYFKLVYEFNFQK